MGYDVSSDKISADVDRWITGRNAERDRKILKRRLIDGPTYEQLAAEFDMSAQAQNFSVMWNIRLTMSD